MCCKSLFFLIDVPLPRSSIALGGGKISLGSCDRSCSVSQFASVGSSTTLETSLLALASRMIGQSVIRLLKMLVNRRMVYIPVRPDLWNPLLGRIRTISSLSLTAVPITSFGINRMLSNIPTPSFSVYSSSNCDSH
jgi:hypothetical protein